MTIRRCYCYVTELISFILFQNHVDFIRSFPKIIKTQIKVLFCFFFSSYLFNMNIIIKHVRNYLNCPLATYSPDHLIILLPIFFRHHVFVLSMVIFSTTLGLASRFCRLMQVLAGGDERFEY